jgi:hypothetical protein
VKLDPRLWEHWNNLNAQAQAAGGAVMDPRMQAAADFYMSQMGPNAGNPYQQQVLDRIQGDYGRLNSMAQMGVNDQFTKAGAFGGSRQGVASGVASGEIARGLGDQMAQLRYQGFNDQMQRGFMGAQGAAGIGQYWQDRPFDFASRAYSMIPQGGQTTTTTNVKRPSLWDIGTGIAKQFATGGVKK